MYEQPRSRTREILVTFHPRAARAKPPRTCRSPDLDTPPAAPYRGTAGGIEMAEETDDGLFVFNGLDAARGGYLLKPMSPDKVLGLAQGEQPDDDARDEAKSRFEASKIDNFVAPAK